MLDSRGSCRLQFVPGSCSGLVNGHTQADTQNQVRDSARSAAITIREGVDPVQTPKGVRSKVNCGFVPVFINVVTETLNFFSDKVGAMEKLQSKLAQSLYQTLGLRVDVRLVAPQTLKRSEGKAQRVIDRRNLEQ